MVGFTSTQMDALRGEKHVVNEFLSINKMCACNFDRFHLVGTAVV